MLNKDKHCIRAAQLSLHYAYYLILAKNRNRLTHNGCMGKKMYRRKKKIMCAKTTPNTMDARKTEIRPNMQKINMRKIIAEMHKRKWQPDNILPVGFILVPYLSDL